MRKSEIHKLLSVTEFTLDSFHDNSEQKRELLFHLAVSKFLKNPYQFWQLNATYWEDNSTDASNILKCCMQGKIVTMSIWRALPQTEQRQAPCFQGLKFSVSNDFDEPFSMQELEGQLVWMVAAMKKCLQELMQSETIIHEAALQFGLEENGKKSERTREYAQM